MAKQKQQKNLTRPFYKSKVFLLLATIIAIPIIYVGWHLILQQIAQYQDRQKFLVAKESTEALAAHLQSKLPQYMWQTEAKCQTQVKKYDIYRSCWTAVRTTITIKSPQQGVDAVDSINKAVPQNIKDIVVTKKTADVFPDFTTYFSTQVNDIENGGNKGQDARGAVYKVANTELLCTLDYSIEKQDLVNKTLELTVNFVCTGDALQEWFQV